MRAVIWVGIIAMGCGAGTSGGATGTTGLAGTWRFEFDYKKQGPLGETSGRFVWKLPVEDSVQADGVFFTLGACQFWAPLVSEGAAQTSGPQDCTVPAGQSLIPLPEPATSMNAAPGKLTSARLEIRSGKLSFAYDAVHGVDDGTTPFIAAGSSNGTSLGTREPLR